MSQHAFLGLKPIKLRLQGPIITVNSAANTALATASVVQFTAAQFPELTQLFSLYSLCRIINLGIFFKPIVTVAAVATSAGVSGAVAIELDTTVGAPNSVNTVLESTHRYGPFWSYNSLQPSQSHYLFDKLVYNNVPKLTSLSTADSPGGSWFIIDDTPPTTVNLFAVTAYIGALGTTGQTALLYYPWIDIECKMRT